MAICENASPCAWRLLTSCCDVHTLLLFFVEADHSWRSFFLLIVRCFFGAWVSISWWSRDAYVHDDAYVQPCDFLTMKWELLDVISFQLKDKSECVWMVINPSWWCLRRSKSRTRSRFGASRTPFGRLLGALSKAFGRLLGAPKSVLGASWELLDVSKWS